MMGLLRQSALLRLASEGCAAAVAIHSRSRLCPLARASSILSTSQQFLMLQYRSDTLLSYSRCPCAFPALLAGPHDDQMYTIAFWFAIIGYIAVWCAIFSPLAWLIRTVGRASNDHAERIAFFACYVGAVLMIVGPLVVIVANNPSLRFPGEVLDTFHERCSASWCSKLLAWIIHEGWRA